MTTSFRIKNIFIPLLAFAFLFLAATTVQGEETTKYTPLAPISLDGSTAPVPVNLPAYLQNIFRFAVAFSAVLAIFMIVLGGLQYMSTDTWSGKSDGRERIKNALFGLGLVIMCYLILATINPDLVTFKALRSRSLNTVQNRPTIGSDGKLTNTDPSGTGAQQTYTVHDPETGKDYQVVGTQNDPAQITEVYSIKYSPGKRDSSYSNEQACRNAEAEYASSQSIRVINGCRASSGGSALYKLAINGETSATEYSQSDCEATARRMAADASNSRYLQGTDFSSRFKCVEIEGSAASSYLLTVGAPETQVNNLTKSACDSLASSAQSNGGTIINPCTVQTTYSDQVIQQ